MQQATITHTPPTEHPSKPSKPPKEGWRSIASTLGLLLAAPVIALFLTSFVFQSYEVEGPSMERTLQHGDRLIVLKLGKTWSNLFHNSFVPKRGDVIVFHRPDNAGPGLAGEKQLIKRVVALPGETVQVRDGTLTVYNEDDPDGFQPDATGRYQINDGTTPGEGTWTVPQGQVFVAGDNRFNSLDSRSFGPIDTDLIVGSLSLRIYPFNKFDSF